MTSLTFSGDPNDAAIAALVAGSTVSVNAPAEAGPFAVTSRVNVNVAPFSDFVTVSPAGTERKPLDNAMSVKAIEMVRSDEPAPSNVTATSR
jgi:hypothetical protein